MLYADCSILRLAFMTTIAAASVFPSYSITCYKYALLLTSCITYLNGRVRQRSVQEYMEDVHAVAAYCMRYISLFLRFYIPDACSVSSPDSLYFPSKQIFPFFFILVSLVGDTAEEGRG
jgi:hypothetical protein